MSRVKKFTDPLLNATMEAILSIDWKKREVYGDFLAQTHYHICHSTRLLAAAAARFGIDQDDWHLQCVRHAAEERSHEKLSISDLNEVGLSLTSFSELPATKSLYQTIYFLIEHKSPVAILGYAYFLEKIGVAGASLAEILVPVYGKKAVKHVTLHANEDPAHIEVYEDKLDAFTGKELAVLEEAIETTAYLYSNIYIGIVQRSGSQLRKKAA